jgi:hypothetical protein
MIRIGFDPGLEAQQDHKGLYKQNELLRLAYEGLPQTHSGLSATKILARLGREMAALGSSLEARYGDALGDREAMNKQDSSSGCAT